MKYQVGDTVIIRKDLEVKQYGENCVTAEMLAFKGKAVVIDEVQSDGQYKIVGCNLYGWTNEMFGGSEMEQQLEFNSRFNYGDTIYLIERKDKTKICNVCNGSKVIEHPVDKIEVRCPYCNGRGVKYIHGDLIWCVDEKPRIVKSIRIKAKSADNYKISYGLVQGDALGEIQELYTSENKNLFSSKELAQRECNKRNRVTKTMSLDVIRVTKAFENTPPVPDKIKECYENYRNTGSIGKEIVVNEDNFIIDGYVGYLVLKMMGIRSTKVVIDDYKLQ